MTEEGRGLPKFLIEHLQRLLGEDPVIGVQCPEPCVEYHEGSCDGRNACSRMLKQKQA